MHTRRTLNLIALLAAALLLAACQVTFLPGDVGTTPVDRPRDAAPPTDVVRPRPPTPSEVLPSDAGFGLFQVGPSTIRPGDQLYFRVRVLRSGYLTISAMAPDGAVKVLLRDVEIGVLPVALIFPRPDSGTPLIASEPAGTWRVRAQLMPRPTGARYDGLRGLEAWTDAIVANLEGFEDASVFETEFEVQRR